MSVKNTVSKHLKEIDGQEARVLQSVVHLKAGVEGDQLRVEGGNA